MKRLLVVLLFCIPFTNGCGEARRAAAISVAISPASGSIQTGAMQQFTVTVTGTTNTAVTWSLSGAGCMGAACGTLSSTTANPVTYTAPGTVPNPPTVALTASSQADMTKSAAATITITVPPPISVSVVPTAANVQTGAMQQFTATVMNDTSNSGVTWSVTGAGCVGAACGTVSPASTASGSPTTYTAPAVVPNPATVTLKATSVADNTKSASATITIASPNSRLNGQYAFLFNGFDVAGQVAIAGSFTADGAGNLTAGVLDINRSSGVSQMVAFTGTYSVGADNRGTMTFTDLAANSTTFRFVLQSLVFGVANRARFIEFDASGTRGSGILARQDRAAFSLAALSGDSAFGFIGELPGTGRTGIVGRYTADAGGTVSNAVLDISVPGTSFNNLAWTGSLATVSSRDGRGTATINVTVPPPGPGALTLNFAFYVVSSTELFLVGVNARSATTPLLSGLALRQSGGPFSNASFNAASVFAVEGVFQGGGSVAVGVVSPNGAGSVTSGVFDQNENGAIFTNVPITGTYSIAANGRATFVFQINPTNAKPQILYMIGPNRAFLLEDAPGNSVTFGMLEPQAAGPFDNNSVSGGFALGTIQPIVDFAQDNVAVFNFTGAGSFSGTQDMTDPVSQTADVALAGTYAVAANGRGTFSLTMPAPSDSVFYVVSRNKLVMVATVTPGDAAPRLIVLGRQISIIRRP